MWPHVGSEIGVRAAQSRLTHPYLRTSRARILSVWIAASRKAALTLSAPKKREPSGEIIGRGGPRHPCPPTGRWAHPKEARHVAIRMHLLSSQIEIPHPKMGGAATPVARPCHPA